MDEAFALDDCYLPAVAHGRQDSDFTSERTERKP